MKELIVGQFFGNVLFETFRDQGVTRPRVRPISDFDQSILVDFPRDLREMFPIGTRFMATAKVCKKHRPDGTPYGRSYLYAKDIALVADSVRDTGLIARVREGSISGLSYQYHWVTKF